MKHSYNEVLDLHVAKVLKVLRQKKFEGLARDCNYSLHPGGVLGIVNLILNGAPVLYFAGRQEQL